MHLMKESRKFARLQKRRFSGAEKKRFLWQTQNPYVRAREEELLATLAMEEADTVLEVGCGEGANIHNLRALGCRTRFVGIDYSRDRAAFCCSQNRDNSLFLCGDALYLPFPDGLFDFVYCRDLLHHVNHARKKAISEMIRVCKRDAIIVIIESNGRKLTLILWALLSPSEKGMIDSTPEKIKRMSKEYEDIVTLKGVLYVGAIEPVQGDSSLPVWSSFFSKFQLG